MFIGVDKSISGVPHGTILGPLLFNLFINTMQFNIAQPCELVQYADDTFLFSAGTELNDAISNLHMNIENLVTFFESHKLNLNENKPEFIVFSKRSKNHLKSNLNLKVKNELLQHSSKVKYLGVFLDQNLNFQEETKHILRKMACGIETFLSIRNYFPEKILLTLLNALVISHLQYPSILLNLISQTIITTLKKQLSCGVKACFHRKKIRIIERFRNKNSNLAYPFIP